jgi:hypothetical protein
MKLERRLRSTQIVEIALYPSHLLDLVAKVPADASGPEICLKSEIVATKHFHNLGLTATL